MNLDSPDQIFSALSDGRDVYWCEEGSDDWTPLNQKAQISFSDLYTGFLKFMALDLPVIKMPIPVMDTRYFSDFIRNEQGLEIYRVGSNPCRFYALKVKGNTFISDYFRNIDIYHIESNGSLKKVDKALAPKWLTENLERTRTANRRRVRNSALEKVGFFGSREYEDFQKSKKYSPK
ncbi:hypothetical protein PFCIP103579_0174 [Prolinoborus fasciculus]|nr:hypothetical protein [Prolinoborus fasciculus]SPJ19030.1 hypothetical protein PFCIP103579_0174 [Prolinoborus fasciculus]